MDTLAACQQMVDQQVRTWEVLDRRVLETLARVPREAFVPANYRELAFVDADIPIGHGEFMLAPNLQGRILQALALDAADSVLEIGTGSGYLCACLGALARTTHSIDIRADFTALAAANLRAVPAANVKLETRDAFAGTLLGKFDAIAVTGSLPVYEARFEQALAVGGRLFVVIGSAPVMDALLVRRVEVDQWTRESLFETVIPPLVNAEAAPRFVF